jgi:hypothetical protein
LVAACLARALRQNPVQIAACGLLPEAANPRARVHSGGSLPAAAIVAAVVPVARTRTKIPRAMLRDIDAFLLFAQRRPSAVYEHLPQISPINTNAREYRTLRMRGQKIREVPILPSPGLT